MLRHQASERRCDRSQAHGAASSEAQAGAVGVRARGIADEAQPKSERAAELGFAELAEYGTMARLRQSVIDREGVQTSQGRPQAWAMQCVAVGVQGGVNALPHLRSGG